MQANFGVQSAAGMVGQYVSVCIPPVIQCGPRLRSCDPHVRCLHRLYLSNIHQMSFWDVINLQQQLLSPPSRILAKAVSHSHVLPLT